MALATINVKYVNDPKPGKKMGSVKTANDETFFFYPDKVSPHKGELRIEYEDKTFGDRPAKVITKIVNDNASPAAGGRSGDPQMAERIYVCGIVNAYVSKADSDVTAASLVAVTNAAREAWAATFGAPADPESPF